LNAFVADRYDSLTFDAEPAQRELVRQAALIRRLEQPWTQGAMHLDAGSNDLSGAIPKPSRPSAFLFHSP
jgi:hypothetical protein